MKQSEGLAIAREYFPDVTDDVVLTAILWQSTGYRVNDATPEELRRDLKALADAKQRESIAPKPITLNSVKATLRYLDGDELSLIIEDTGNLSISELARYNVTLTPLPPTDATVIVLGDDSNV